MGSLTFYDDHNMGSLTFHDTDLADFAHLCIALIRVSLTFYNNDGTNSSIPSMLVKYEANLMEKR